LANVLPAIEQDEEAGMALMAEKGGISNE